MIYNQLEKSMAEKSVALEVVSYHATCAKSELEAFLTKNQAALFQKPNKCRKETLSSYVFDDFSLNTDEMVISSYEILKESNLLKSFQIEKQVWNILLKSFLFESKFCRKFSLRLYFFGCWQ